MLFTAHPAALLSNASRSPRALVRAWARSEVTCAAPAAQAAMMGVASSLLVQALLSREIIGLFVSSGGAASSYINHGV